MLRTLRFFAIAAFGLGLLAGFYFLPSGPVNSDTGNSPLFAASLNSTTDQISGKEPGRGIDSKGGGEGNLITCEITCGPTCNQTTCGTTCVSTCQLTCTNTCNQATCTSTCVATCSATCANTCSQPTCESTCVVTCTYTCEEPIGLIGFEALAVDGGVQIRWNTGSEVDNFTFNVYRSVNSPNSFGDVPVASLRSSGNGVNTNEYIVNDPNVQAGNTYFYKLEDVSIYGYSTMHNNVVSVSIAGQFDLAQNFPNPFNPSTTIRFSVPTSAQTRLDVYDLSGRLVSTLVNGLMDAGVHEVVWNAKDMSSGMYLYRLTAADQTANGKMMFVK